ncbi:MAG: hypothetical protein LBQ30_10920 [Treponema sp.]|jgi:hypothetical protein|nr:hypothetical protein [Treponema sp.]
MIFWLNSLWLKICVPLQTLKKSAAEALQTQRKLVLLCLGGFGMLLLCLIGILLIPDHTPKISWNFSRTLSDDFKPLSIAPEELFLPDEPDFLPEVILEREPRSPWTAEDVRPFWTDPLHDDPERWREQVQTAIDELLEGVP